MRFSSSPPRLPDQVGVSRGFPHWPEFTPSAGVALPLIQGEQLLELGGHEKAVLNCVFAPSSSLLLASSSSDGTVRIWQLRVGDDETLRGQQTLELQLEPNIDLFALAWSPDSAQLAAGGSDELVHIWHTQTGK